MNNTREQPTRVVILGVPDADPIITTPVIEPVDYIRNVSAGTAEPIPSAGGFEVDKFSMAALRMRVTGTGATPSYSFEIWTKGSSLYIKAPCETRIGYAEDYFTRFFWVWPISQKIAVRIVATNRDLRIEWSAG